MPRRLGEILSICETDGHEVRLIADFSQLVSHIRVKNLALTRKTRTNVSVDRCSKSDLTLDSSYRSRRWRVSRACRERSDGPGFARRPPTPHAGNAPCARIRSLPRRLRDGHDDICLSARCGGVFRTPRIARWKVAARNRSGRVPASVRRLNRRRGVNERVTR